MIMLDSLKKNKKKSCRSNQNKKILFLLYRKKYKKSMEVNRMKSLSIKSDSCLLNKSSFGVDINELRIDKLIDANLPSELKEYKDYPVKISIQIEFLGEEGIEINTEGYEPPKEENEEEK